VASQNWKLGPHYKTARPEGHQITEALGKNKNSENRKLEHLNANR